MENSRRSRRAFLENSIKSFGFLGISSVLSNSIVQAIASSAYGAASGDLSASDPRYIYFSLDGAPPRWFFDSPLTPATNFTSGITAANKSEFVLGGFGSYIDVVAGKATVDYRNWKVPGQNLYLPPVWGSHPAKGAFAQCLSGAMFIRGIDMEINNHEISRLRNQSPVIGGLSVGGLIASKAKSPLQALISGGIGNSFRSDSNASAVPVDHSVDTARNTNSMTRIASYFNAKKVHSSAAQAQALEAFDDYAKSNNIIPHGSSETKERVDTLITKGVSKFADQWGPVYAKYLGLVRSAYGDSRNTALFKRSGVISVVGLQNDKRLQYADKKMATVADLNALVNEESTVTNLAATFAALEILYLSGLAQVATFSLGSPGNILVDGKTKTGITNDQHSTGSLVSTLVTTYYYRAILMCTEELIAQLKGAGIYQKTFIQFGSEFNRNPRADGSGSDHGVAGGSSLILSGTMSGVSVVGNILKNGNDMRYAGTWGEGASVAGQKIRIDDVVATICYQLGVASASTNGLVLRANLGAKNV